MERNVVDGAVAAVILRESLGSNHRTVTARRSTGVATTPAPGL
jgi:hypothetical protein